MSAGRLTLVLLTALAMGQASARTAPEPARRISNEQRVAAHFERIRRDPIALRRFLYAFPKGADLHTHLGGAVYAETYIAWAAGMGLCVDLASDGFVEAAEPPRAGEVACPNPSAQRPASDALRDPALYRRLVDALSMRHHDPATGAGAYRFFDAFDRFRAVVRGGSPDSARIAGESLAELVGRAGAQHVQHVEVIVGVPGSAGAALQEVRWSGPDDLAAYHDALLRAGLLAGMPESVRWLDDMEGAMRARLACGTAAASPGCGVSVRYLAGLPRAAEPPQVFSQMIAALELASADPRVVGVNPVQPEDWYVPRRDYALHMRMFAFLRERHPDVPLSLHAGELAFGQVPPEDLGWHVRQAVEVAGARRIGHGVDIVHDPKLDELLADMARRKVAVEINLSSNDYILGVRGAHHPLRTYLRAGVPVVLSTDDEGVSRSDLTHEYQRAVEEHGLTYAELKRISRDGIAHSFLPDEEKARLRARLEAALADFERSLR